MPMPCYSKPALTLHPVIIWLQIAFKDTWHGWHSLWETGLPAVGMKQATGGLSPRTLLDKVIIREGVEHALTCWAGCPKVKPDCC